MNNEIVILIVDDIEVNRVILKGIFEQDYKVIEADDGTTALDILNRGTKVDIILLDIIMPVMNGIDFLKEIKKNKSYSEIPVIMVTAKTSEIDAVKGLDMGADDYITKPFGVMELVSRTKAVLRRTAKKVKTVLVYKNIEIDENKHTVLVDGAEIDLTYKEYEILKHLIRNKGIVLTRDRLMEIVWGYNFEQGNRTVDVHIQSLRKKLGTAGEHIKTIRNVGYKVGE